MENIDRVVFHDIKKWMFRREILAIKGPRQSGKTTILGMLRDWLIIEKKVSENNIFLVTFEDRELLNQFMLDTKEFIKRYIPEKEQFYLFIDEAQYCKDLGQKLKYIYDTYKNIKLVITGSSSLELTSSTGAFLVGRMFSFELLPLSFKEFLSFKNPSLAKIYGEKKEEIMNFISRNKLIAENKGIFKEELLNYLDEYLTFGGYPEVVKANNDEEKRVILKNLYNTYVEKDILLYLQITDEIKFSKLVSVLSSINGGLISYDKLASECNSYFKEIIQLLDILQQTFIIRLLRPYHKNLVTELRKNPKLYFYDFGLRNYAVNNFSGIQLREDTGRSIENFIFNELSEISNKINFWRTTNKAEVDFVVEISEELIPIESKFESMKKPKITRSFHSFINSYKPKKAIVLTKDFQGVKKIENTTVLFIPVLYI